MEQSEDWLQTINPLFVGGWNQETGGNKKCFIVENELIEITEQLLEER